VTPLCLPLNGPAEELGRIIKTQIRPHREKVFAGNDLPFAPVSSMPEALSDPQARHLCIFEPVQQPTEGEIVGIRNPIRINGIRGPVVAPPTRGELDRQAPAPPDIESIKRPA
jgi:crotonobetainyl-CoA:carnitine CoA-transferase CaiB-like acyl-CoA transferase